MGTLVIEKTYLWGSNVGHIEDIIIDKNHRGKGYGKILLNKIIEKSKKYGCYKIILYCEEKNVGFYEKNGFQQKNVEMSLYL